MTASRNARSPSFQMMDMLPNKVLLHVFTYLSHKEVLKCALVCKRWRATAYDSRLWTSVCLRPEYDGFQVCSIEALLGLISVRFGSSLSLIELATDLITAPVLHELANKCPNLQYLTLDFSSAMQLHDFADLQAFPTRLRSLTICLSENIFLEGFMRKIYSFLNPLEILHIIGTYEKIEDEEEEVYETINLHKLKAFTPNLRVVNFWGMAFLNDDHINSLSSNTPQLECLAINFCQNITGTCLKTLLTRCKRIRTLLMEQTALLHKEVMDIEWDKTPIEELNISATELSSECLISLLTRLPKLRWLSATFLENFNDQVMEAWIHAGTYTNLIALDLDTCDSLSEKALSDFIYRQGPKLRGLNLCGNEKLLEHFWLTTIPITKKIEGRCNTRMKGTTDDEARLPLVMLCIGLWHSKRYKLGSIIGFAEFCTVISNINESPG
ncbi:unnamed protein product [Soboliphyme baturini]|uniref:F-box domain-containing protein n=1 Tax=Soboliphyme baturini TaxID=241478 RepID=A0A183IMZ4_9BILA|nr:unnamed protein product [Soboliphyme baturini]